MMPVCIAILHSIYDDNMFLLLCCLPVSCCGEGVEQGSIYTGIVTLIWANHGHSSGADHFGQELLERDLLVHGPGDPTCFPEDRVAIVLWV